MPKTKANDLLGKFCDLIADRLQVDEVSLRRFERDAKAELKHDPVPAYTILGAIAAIRFDIDQLNVCHRAAIRLQDDETSRGNYIVSLERVGLLKEAAIEAQDCFRCAPENLAVLEKAIQSNWMAGRLDSLSNLCLEFKKRTLSEHEDMDSACVVAEILERGGATQDDYINGIAIANKVVREAKLPSPQISILTDTDEGDESILYSILVHADEGQILPLRDVLAQSLCDELGDRWKPELMMFELNASI